MVGVAGRSKGCRTCRRRKKGCDLQEPICGNCIRTNNFCEYDRQQVFINMSGPGRGTGMVVAKHTVPRADIVLRHSLARTAYEDKYLSLFWNSWFPCGRQSAEILPKYPIYSWISCARDLYQHDKALWRTLLAMCFCTLGRQSGKSELMADGFQMYTQALREVNASLRHPTRWKSDAVMVASRGLGLFEDQSQVEGSQARSWHGHNLGELALIRLRGPEAYIEGYAHTLFAEGRMHLAIAGCMDRKRNFLSEDAWKTIPWTKIPKSPKDVLLDILIDLPALLEEVDLLQQAPGSGAEISRRFMQTYQRLDREIAWWLQNLSPPRKILDDLHERNYKNPTADDLAVAHIMTHFWAACIVVYSSLHMALLLPKFTGIDSIVFTERTDPRPYCVQIADVVDIFFQPEAGTFGLHSAPFPVGMAIKYLMFTEGLTSPDCARLIGYFSRQSGGAAMGRFLMNSYPEWTKNESRPAKLEDVV
ncbi:uncharacterized protein CTRU02_206136 [Colletotrichum truncatum]|uniref:Uncharacterized protein n=1 Tax=Colletotrichum truncatum TaxID=5467 RepID=A0ACC3Z5Z3_COLTU